MKHAKTKHLIVCGTASVRLLVVPGKMLTMHTTLTELMPVDSGLHTDI